MSLKPGVSSFRQQSKGFVVCGFQASKRSELRYEKCAVGNGFGMAFPKKEGLQRRSMVEAPVYRSKSGKNDKKIVNFVVSGNCFCVWGWDEGVEVPPAALRVNHPTLRRCQVANHASGGLCVGVMR